MSLDEAGARSLPERASGAPRHQRPWYTLGTARVMGLLALLWGIWPHPALGKTPEEALEQARILYREVSFEAALGSFQQLTVLASASPEVRRDAHEGAAFCLIALGRVPEAKAAFMRALALDPGHELDRIRVSPKIAAVFDEALAADRATAAVGIEVVSSASPQVTLRVTDPANRVGRVVVEQARGVGEADRIEALRSGDGLWTAQLEPADGALPRGEVLAFNVHGFVLARLRDVSLPVAPLSLPPLVQAPERRFPGWLVAGTLTGAALAGGGTWLGLRARDGASAFNGDPDAFPDHSTAVQTGRTALQDATLANVLFAGAALVATTGLVLHLTGGPDGPGGTHLAASGGGLVLTGTWE